MQYGQIVLARNFKNILSYLIAKITNGYFSHTFILAPAVKDRLLCIEAEAQDVTAVPFDIGYEQNPEKDFIVYSINIPQDQIDNGLNAVINKLETGYGFLQMPWFIWRWICKKVGKDIKNQNNWFNQDGSLCSQLVVEYLTAANLGDLFKEFGKGSVSPDDIYKIVKSRPDIFVEVKRKIRYPNDPRL